MKKVYTLFILAFAAIAPAFAQWNTNATPVCIYDAAGMSDYYACNPKAVRTPDKKTWIAWHTWGRKAINGIDRVAVRTYLQLLNRDGVPQFSEPIMLNDHVTTSWWSDYGLQVASDGSAIVTVADGRAEEATLPDETDHADGFSPAIYKVDQQGNFLWGEDGIAYPQYTNAGFTNCYVVGDDTYFIFFNTTEDSSGQAEDMTNIGTFIQRINADGTVAWSEPFPWSDDFAQPQIVPSLDGTFLLFDRSPEGSVVHRLDRELNEVWGEPVVYDEHKYEGYAMNDYSIAPDGFGGAAVAFVRNMGQFAHNVRVQHVNADGSLGFGLNGLDVANTEDNDYDYCDIAVNPKTEEILVDFESQLATTYDVMLQKFSYDGDYLFDEMGISIANKDRAATSYAFGRVGCGAVGDGQWIVAYRDVQGYFNASFIIRRYDADGNSIWSRTIGREIDPTDISFFVEEEATYLIYRENRESKESGIKIFRIGNDGSYDVTYDDTSIQTVAVSSDGSEQYYDASGRRLSQPQKGLNIIRSADGTVQKQLK